MLPLHSHFSFSLCPYLRIPRVISKDVPVCVCVCMYVSHLSWHTEQWTCSSLTLPSCCVCFECPQVDSKHQKVEKKNTMHHWIWLGWILFQSIHVEMSFMNVLSTTNAHTHTKWEWRGMWAEWHRITKTVWQGLLKRELKTEWGERENKGEGRRAKARALLLKH